MQRICLIGAGDRGRIYSRCFAKRTDIVLAAVCDIDKSRADGFVREFGFESSYTDYKEAIEKSDAQIAVICTPAYFHCEMAKTALQNGMHVLSEKPLDLSLSACHETIMLAEKKNKIYAVGLQYRNAHAFRCLKTAFEGSLLSRPLMMRFTDIREVRPKTAMHDLQYGNGGPLVDMLCHYVDLMRFLLDSRPVSVYAGALTLAKDSEKLSKIEKIAPDTGNVTIRFGSGDIGVVTISWGMAEGVQYPLTCEVFSKDGMIKPFDIFGDGRLNEFGKSRVFVTAKGNIDQAIEADFTREAPEDSAIEQFLACVQSGEGEPQVSAEDALITLATSFAALKSAKTGREIPVSEMLESDDKAVDFFE